MMPADVIGQIYYTGSTNDGSSAWLAEYVMPSAGTSNIERIPVQMPIKDLRGQEKSFNLDENGFEVVSYTGCIQEDFEPGSEKQNIAYAEIHDLLKKRLGASRVHMYHHAFRFRSPSLDDEKLNRTHRNPAFYPHMDVDAAAVHGLLAEIFGKDEAERLKRKRIQYIHLWRPVGPNPVTEKPLTLCDYRSIDQTKDVIPLNIRGGNDKIFTAFILARNTQDTHAWYYLSEMRSDEMFIFKSYDSKPDVAQWAPHTAFLNTTVPSPHEEQKSLEFRCLVFYDNDDDN